MFYFAYGANLNLQNMRYRCPNAKVVGHLNLPEYQLVFKGVADIEPSRTNSVDGLLWWITDDCEKALDVYEGFPHLYRKENFVIKLNDGLAKEFGEIQDVMFYAMNSSNYGTPSITYYDTIKQGYIDNGLDLEKLNQAKKYSEEKTEYNFGSPYRSKLWSVVT